MNEVTKEVKVAFENVEEFLERFDNQQAPNEDIDGIDYEEYKFLVQSISGRMDINSKPELINNVKRIITELEMPYLDFNTASRGILQIRLMNADLISALYKLKDTARFSGYIDPDTPDTDLSQKELSKKVEEILFQLAEAKSSLQKLETNLSANKKTGVSIGTGGVSVDLGILIEFIKERFLDIQMYIEDKLLVNSDNLILKLQSIKTNTVILAISISDKSRYYGRRAVRFAGDVATASTRAVISGLELLNLRWNTIDEANDKISPDSGKGDRAQIMTSIIKDFLERGEWRNARQQTIYISKCFIDLKNNCLHIYADGDFEPNKAKSVNYNATIEFIASIPIENLEILNDCPPQKLKVDFNDILSKLRKDIGWWQTFGH